MTRRANKNPPTPPGCVLFFEPHEFRFLKHNHKPPKSDLGGMQTTENWLIANTDVATLRCYLDPTHLERIIRFCRPDYRGGGPNGRIRAACIPALRRAGIDVAPDWRAPPDADSGLEQVTESAETGAADDE